MTLIAQDVIDTLQTREELADAGRALALDLDTGRFALGDVGMRCATVYGENSLGTLASDIGLARAHAFRPVLKQFVPTHTINLTEIAEGKSA